MVRTPIKSFWGRFPQAIFLDFDGVIVESSDIKTAAFRTLFSAERPAVLKQILAYHRLQAGISRFVKFDHIHREILHRPFSRAQKKVLADAFARFVRHRVKNCPLVPGMGRFLAGWTRGVDLHIVSGTPRKELRWLVRAKRLDRFFLSVQGSPPDKATIIRRILRLHGYERDRVAFVGDGRSDWQAARAGEIPFIGRVRPGERSPFPVGTPVVRDGVDLAGLMGTCLPKRVVR